MEKRFIDILIYYYNNRDKYISMTALPKTLTMHYENPRDVYNLIGAQYNNLFEEDKTRSHFYKLNKDGLEFTSKYVVEDSTKYEMTAMDLNFELGQKYQERKDLDLPALNPQYQQNKQITNDTKKTSKSFTLNTITNNPLVSTIVGGFILAIILKLLHIVG